jgi:hypothetical protein
VLHKCIGILACYSYKTVSVKLFQAKYILYLWVVGANYEASCSLSNNHKGDASSLCMEVCNRRHSEASWRDRTHKEETHIWRLASRVADILWLASRVDDVQRLASRVAGLQRLASRGL